MALLAPGEPGRILGVLQGAREIADLLAICNFAFVHRDDIARCAALETARAALIVAHDTARLNCSPSLSTNNSSDWDDGVRAR